MLRYALRRAVAAAATLAVVALITFWLFELLPGDAATTLLTRGSGVAPPPETLAALRSELGLDRPAPVRFLEWLSGFAHGDLGTSLVSGRPVFEIAGGRAGNSLVLAGVATLLIVPLAVGLGLLAGSRPGSRLDRAVSMTMLGVEAMPAFVVGVFLVATVALAWGLLPAVSLVPSGTSPLARPAVLVLPTVCLVAGLVPHPARVIRAQTVDVMASEYIRVARVSGVGPARLLLRHVAPNAVSAAVHPLAASLVGLVGGIAVIEVLFGYPGLAQELLRAISARDLPVVQSVAVLLAAFGLAVYLIGDLLALWLSPAARRSQGIG